MYRRRTKGKTIRQLKREFQQKQLIRGLCVGLSTRAIASQLRLTPQTVRDWVATPEVQGALAEYEREHFEALDRRFQYSMNLAMEEFVRQLKKKNWKAVERMLADTGILGRMMEHYLAKLERESSATSLPSSRPGDSSLIPPDDMTPRERELARELMRSVRQRQGQRAMPSPRLINPESP